MIKKSMIFLCLSIALVQIACQSHKEEKHEEIKFLVWSPVVTDTIIAKDYVAQIQSINHVELRAQERGYLQKVYVDEGQFVHKGQLLFKVMPNLYQADVNKAKAEANYTEIEYKNTLQLYKDNVVSKSELA